MTLQFANGQSVDAQCDRCTRTVLYFGTSARKRYYARRETFGIDLCELCRGATLNGSYEYTCEGCGIRVHGSFEEVGSQLNCFEKAFCRSCMTGFYGKYDPNNRAIRYVQRRRINPYRPDRFEEEQQYQKEVRRLSRVNYRRSIDVLNPRRLLLGPAGKKGAYQIDHIVPVTVCFQRSVPVKWAAHASNLQVIPWFVNVSRNNKFELEWLVGWPRRSTSRRLAKQMAPMHAPRSAGRPA
jgi:hypothetical protein